MNIAKPVREFFASFTIKLFLWFWLIAIISIVSTRFISHQMSVAASHKPTSTQLTTDEMKQLRFTVRRISKSNIHSIAALKIYYKKNIKQKHEKIWLKNIQKDVTNIQNLFPLPKHEQQAVSRFLNGQVFTQPKTYLFPHARLIGPMYIQIDKQEYQLFISRRHHKRSFAQLVGLLPTWGRIAIPAFISFVLCLLLARSFSKPIRKIKQASANIGKGDFTTRVSINTRRNDELGQLANSFNQMAEQLQQQQTAQRRLLGDVSHELRSPMTRLQMALGLAQQAVTTEQAREQYLQRCQVEIDRLDQMVAKVLSLSRLENTLQSIDIEKIKFSSLLDTIVSDEQFIADERSIKIIGNYCDDIFINADRALLISAISNVLSNAVKYSPNQSTVTVNLSKQHQQLVLTIEDEGHGVPDEALSQLFSPFYRVNLARDRKTGGTGLGLAIAKQAILAHKGKITAQNRTEDIQLVNGENSHSMTGLSVSIELPCL